MTVRTKIGHNVMLADQWFPGAAIRGVVTNMKKVGDVYESDGTGYTITQNGEATVAAGTYFVHDPMGATHMFTPAEFDKIFEVVDGN